MKTKLFQVDKQGVFPDFFKNSLDSFYITLTSVFGVNHNVIEVHGDKNIKFFCYNFVDLALEDSESIGKTERHNLVLKIAVPYLENCFSLITLQNSYSMIYICQVQLSKTLGAT